MSDSAIELPPRDFAVLLPPGWVRIPINTRERERVIEFVARQVDQLPATSRESVRRVLTRALHGALDDARAAGAVDVLLHVSAVGDVPIAASCVVTSIDPGQDGLTLDRVLSSFAGTGELSVVSIADHPAVRRWRTEQQESNGASITTTLVEFFVPMPGDGGLLVLTFGTPIEPLAEALTSLFDAIAATLRWVS